MHTLWLLLAQSFLVMVGRCWSEKPRVSAVIVFGDSSVDAGNNNNIPTILKSNFEPYGRDFSGGHPTGRFCNGRVPTDFISEHMRLKPVVPAYLDPSYNITEFATGVCFASAGTGYDSATSDVLSVIPFAQELEYYKEYQNRLRAYLGDEKANVTITEALYAISIGTNDFLENYYLLPTRRHQYDIDEYQNFLAGVSQKFLRDLYHLGARKVSLGGLPPMGCLPLERTLNLLSGSECNEMYNNVAVEFNQKLASMVENLNKELPGIALVFANPYNIFLDIIQNPSQYGFEVASVACCATGLFEMGYACDQNNLLTCTDANKYVFWDAFHPTEKTNRIIADDMAKRYLTQFM